MSAKGDWQGWESYVALSDFVRCALRFSQFLYIHTVAYCLEMLVHYLVILSYKPVQQSQIHNRLHCISAGQCFYNDMRFVLRVKAWTAAHHSEYNSQLCWMGFPGVWSCQKPSWNWYLIPVMNFGEVWRAQLAKSTLLTSTLGPWDIFRTFKICSDAKKRAWDMESNGKLLHLFISSKTETLVPEFEIQDLPLDRTAKVVPAFAMKDLPLGRTQW